MPDVLATKAASEPRTRSEPSEPIAPWPHTVLLVCVLALWAVYGMLHSRLLAGVMPRGMTYISHIIIEFLLVGSTIAGLYHRRRFVREVFGSMSLRVAAFDIGEGCLVYVAGVIVMVVIGAIIRPLHPSFQKDAVLAMAPHTAVELVLWMMLSFAAGSCEEFLFRGYLLRQFECWWGGVPVAIVVSSVLFGCLHLYEGWGAVVGLCWLGAVYAIVAVRRGNLRSVIVGHFLQDAITGLVLYLRHGA